MSRCRWDRESKTYRTAEGQECTVDAYGDPTRHCGTHRCSWHVGTGELHCARCVAGVRRDLRWITPLASLLMPQAITDGIDSEAANLAGPTADAEAWSWRKVAAKQGRAWHVSLEEDDDEHHPYRVLGTWARMVSEDYGHPMPHDASMAWCQGYLDRQLHRIAQDPEQDFPLLRAELRRCRSHLEAVLHNDDRPDRGAPCPECTSETEGVGPRLVRVYSHWCEDETCEKVHIDDESRDLWACPRNPEHVWSHEAYERWVAERGQRRARSVKAEVAQAVHAGSV